jgi:hypothetical protein
MPSNIKQKSIKKRKRELTPYKHNVSVKYSMLTSFHIPQQVVTMNMRVNLNEQVKGGGGGGGGG